MPNPLFAVSSLAILLVAPAPAHTGPEREPLPAMIAQQPQQQQRAMTIHVPRVTITSTTIILRSAPAPRFREKKTHDCVEVKKLAGFAGVNTSDSVDLVLQDGSLLRAKLGRDCPAIGFYQGFYVKANEDRKICAGRDAIRTRSGRTCEVAAFRKLVAER